MRYFQRGLFCAAALGLTFTAEAQTSLDSQIDAVYAVQQRQQAAAAAVQAAQDAAIQRQMQKQEAAAAAAQRKHEAAVTAEKQRQEGYVDQLRSLEIQRQQLELDAAKVRVNRENDFIDQELQENAARTDAIKAAAEADRNVSLGAKSYLEHAGANAEIGGTGNVVTKP